MDVKGVPFIRLRFPYDQRLVETVKQLQVRKYMPDSKSWIVPYSIDAWHDIVGKLGIEVSADETLTAMALSDDQRFAISKQLKLKSDAEIEDYEFATEPYAHQRIGLKFLALHDKAGLLWEMGTGKTKTIIDDLCRRKLLGQNIRGTLVFCPNEVKYTQWAPQVPLHSGGRVTVEVLEGSIKDRIKRLANSTADLLVLNVESAYYMRDPLLKETFPAIILDEATRFKSPTAQRTKVILKVKAPLRRIMTGTPITNDPGDAYAPFKFLEYTLFGSWTSFKDHYMIMGGYGGYQVVGYRDLEGLKQRVHRYSHRVLKKDVLDLPEKTYHDIEVELGGDTLKHYEEVRDTMISEWQAGKIEARIALTVMLRLEQIAGGLLQQGEDYFWIPDNPKLKALDELLADLPKDQKVVVFAVFRHEIRELMNHYNEWNPVAIYGDVPLKERAAGINAFQGEGGPRMLIAQMHSGGIGINLTAAQTAIYYSRNWSLEDYLQSQDRLHRIGQKGTVNIVHLIAKLPYKQHHDVKKTKVDYSAETGEVVVKVPKKKAVSIDEVIAKALTRKQVFADMITGDKDLNKVKEIKDIVTTTLFGEDAT
jgi:SNF2 family DNA or RNA helicase